MSKRANKCPVCEESAPVHPWGTRDVYIYDCRYCGSIALPFLVEEFVKEQSQDHRRTAAYSLFEYRRSSGNQEKLVIIFADGGGEPTVPPDTIPRFWKRDLLDTAPDPATDLAERSLRNLAGLLPQAGQTIEFSEEVRRATFSNSANTTNIVLDDLRGKKLLVVDGRNISITLEGYRRVRELRDGNRADYPPIDPKGWTPEKVLGAGGQAVVVKATQSGESDTVAVLKILKPWTPASKARNENEQRERLAREVTALSELSRAGCGGIVPVLDQDLRPKEGCQPWYAMPFYPPGPLCRVTSDGEAGRWSEDLKGNLPRVLEIAQEVARVLVVMHAQTPPLVHRDISTPNIFLESVGGKPVLGDFGIAHVPSHGDIFVTGDRENLGPWRWRPPELEAGSDDKHNPRSDVYLLGGVIYEALSGGVYIPYPEYPPGSFKHERPSYSLSQYTDDPRIALVNSLLRRMLALNPEDRFEAEAVVRACSGIISWKPGMSQPTLLSTNTSSSRLLEQLVARGTIGHPYFLVVPMNSTFLREIEIENSGDVNVAWIQFKVTYFQDGQEIGTRVFEIGDHISATVIVPRNSTVKGLALRSKRSYKRVNGPDFQFDSSKTEIGGRATFLRLDVLDAKAIQATP